MFGSVGCTGNSHEDESEPDERPSLGVALTNSVPPLVRSVCDDATKTEVTVTVVCPPLVPRTRLSTHPGLTGVIVFFPDERLYLLTFNNGEVGPGYLHWMVGKGDRTSVEENLLRDDTNVVKGLPHLVSEATVEGRTLRLFEYPPHPAGGPNGGHVAAFVDCGSETVMASVHGTENAGAAQEMALALADAARCPR